MTILPHALHKTLLNKFKGRFYMWNKRLINYSPIHYDGKNDPAPLFFTNEIQSILKSLTRVDYNKVFRRRKLGQSKLKDPEYKFMTDEELQAAFNDAKQKSEEILQIPPVVKVRKPISKVLSRDPALQGLETSRLVFTDITFGVKDNDRIIVVREPDGSLKEAEWDLRQRINQVYFPTPGRTIKPPVMFQESYLENLLERHEYEFVLDRACTQLEPDDPEYQKIVSITYQHLNENNKFELLRSTRHFGTLVFFLVWNKSVDKLLMDLIETSSIDEAAKLVHLYSIIHEVKFDGHNLDIIEDFVKKASAKKGALELAIQSYKEVVQQKQDLHKGIQTAHGRGE